jgi:hypothetical protein
MEDASLYVMDTSSSEDEDEIEFSNGVPQEEVADLLAENDRLKGEQTKLLDTILRLSDNLKDLRSNLDLSLIAENEELNAELQAYRTLVETLKDLSPDEAQHEWAKVSGDVVSAPKSENDEGDDTVSIYKPSASLLRELADEADMKVLSFLAVSQTLQGGNWVKAKYPVGAPSFFQELKFHYQLGKNWLGREVSDPSDRCLNMRFDMFFPGFPASVVAEIVWRLFCSEEHSRVMIRSDQMKFETLHESCDPKSGDRVKLYTLKNPIRGTEKVQQIKLMCRRTRRHVARSTLTIPHISRSRKSGSGNPAKRARSDDDVGNVDAHVVSQSSTKLFPVPYLANSEEIQGQMIRGAFAWQEPEGSRIVAVISYPADYLYNGQHRLSGNATYAFNEAGNVTKWFAKLVEHAAGQFIQYMLEETLHRRGRGVTLAPDSASSAEEEEEIRVVEMPAEASEFLKGLAETTKW